jgi:WD40 repeat protein
MTFNKIINDQSTKCNLLPFSEEIQYNISNHLTTMLYINRTLIENINNNNIYIYNMYTGELVNTLIGHTDQVLVAMYSHDYTKIISSSRDNTIRIWDTRTYTELHRIEGTEHDVSLKIRDISPDGTKFVGYNEKNDIFLWDINTGMRVFEGTLDLSMIDSYLEILFITESMIMIKIDAMSWKSFNFITNELTNIVTFGQHYYGMTLFNNKKYIAFPYSNDLPDDLEDDDDYEDIEAVRIHDVNTHRRIKLIHIEGHNNMIEIIAFSADDKLMLTGADDEVILTSLDDEKMIYKININNFAIHNVMFSPNGDNIIVIGKTKYFNDHKGLFDNYYVYQTSTGQLLYQRDYNFEMS